MSENVMADGEIVAQERDQRADDPSDFNVCEPLRDQWGS